MSRPAAITSMKRRRVIGKIWQSRSGFKEVDLAAKSKPRLALPGFVEAVFENQSGLYKIAAFGCSAWDQADDLSVRD